MTYDYSIERVMDVASEYDTRCAEALVAMKTERRELQCQVLLREAAIWQRAADLLRQAIERERTQ